MKAGIILNKNRGLYRKGMIGTLLSNSEIEESHIEEFKAAFIISEDKVEIQKLIEYVL